MTREEIIALAKQHSHVSATQFHFYPDQLEAFFHAAQKLEREACAKVCEETDVHTFTHGGRAYEDGGVTLANAAAAIRNRGNQ